MFNDPAAHTRDGLFRISGPPNNSLERTQPQREFMYDVAVLRRSARGRWAAGGCRAHAQRPPPGGVSMRRVIVRQSQPEIKFETYRFYLDCLCRFCALQFGDWTSFVQQCAQASSGVRVMRSYDSAYIERLLRIAWNTQWLLEAPPSDIHLIRINNQWAPIQAY